MATAMSGLSTILKHVNINDHEEVLQACSIALQSSPQNTELQHIRAIALLKLDRHEDALAYFDHCGDKLKGRASLPYSYAQYKVGNLLEAQRLARDIGHGRAARHLEAQASYRLEQFELAAALYQGLAASRSLAVEKEEEAETDLRINAGATDAQLEWSRQGHLVVRKKAGREDLEAFETAYNASCACIARREFGAAEVLLERAIQLCESSEELLAQEKKMELRPMKVQKLYLLSMMGKMEKAEALAADIAIEDVPDLSTRYIAQINQLTASSTPTNPYLSQRIFQSSASVPQTDRLFEFQETIRSQDQMVLDLQTAKYPGLAKSTDRMLLEGQPSIAPSKTLLSTANAAAHAQNQLGKLGLKSMIPILEKRPLDVGVMVTIIHLYLLTKNHGAAIKILEAFFKRLEESEAHNDIRFAPGLVAILTSLYSIENRKSQIQTELLKAATYWRRKSKGAPSFLQAAGVHLLDSEEPEHAASAGKIFDDLLLQEPENRFYCAGYVAAYANSANSKVESMLNKLTPTNRLTIGIDAVKLDQAGVPQSQSTASIIGQKRARAEKALPSKKRIRKSRLPRDLDPNKPADPERWLPLRDRTTYRPKGKKGKQKAATLTQGGMTEKGIEASDMTKPTSTVIATPAKQQKKKKPKK